MITDVKELDKYPDVMSKDQFQKACHLSCRKAYWLLNSGLLPCERTGKKTRCYKIKKADVIELIKDYKLNPKKYVMPIEAELRKTEAEFINFSDVSRSDVEDFYRTALKDEPDLLTTKEVAAITGYTKKAVLSWHEKGELKCLSRFVKAYRYPKQHLIAFLASDYYNHEPKKTDIHRKMIKEINRKYGTKE